MKITIVGSGYVGLVTAACLAEVGNQVMCLDTNVAKINTLNQGGIPIHEPGLEALVARNRNSGRLIFSTEQASAVATAQVVFLAVGTPPEEDGSADMRHVLAAAANVGRHAQGTCLVVNKSTVPVGTAESVAQVLQQESRGRSGVRFMVVSNPEFLKEGSAVEDFMKPDRIVVGAEDEAAIRLMREIYHPFQRNHDRMIVMDTKSAEMTKYAANAMLATRISFMNEMAHLAEAVGADIEQVRLGIGSDSRIGHAFLYAGCGYGGSCFPKDVKALLHTASQWHVPMPLVSTVQEVNERQKKWLVGKILKRFNNQIQGRTFALWGLAFKPGTDDMREAPSQSIIEALLAQGARVRAYDPVAMESARRYLGNRPDLSYGQDAQQVVDGADALIVVTEWKEFRSPDFDFLHRKLKQPLIFDGRNLYQPTELRARGFEYFSMGRSGPVQLP